jgi:hypothetical protein
MAKIGEKEAQRRRQREEAFGVGPSSAELRRRAVEVSPPASRRSAGRQSVAPAIIDRTIAAVRELEASTRGHGGVARDRARAPRGEKLASYAPVGECDYCDGRREHSKAAMKKARAKRRGDA